MKPLYLSIFALLMGTTGVLAADVPAEHPADPASPPHWAYTGESGADTWGNISPDYHACSAGMMQAPIDQGDGFQAAGAAFTLNYQPSPLNIIHNGHTVQVNFQPGSSMTVSGKRYELLQVHFHTPSEHAIGGQRMAMEAYFVHKSAEGKLAVLGVMMRVGADNAVLQPVWEHLPASAGPAQDIAGASVDPAAFFPAERSYFRYMGSLTTPPCSEGVNWFVLKEPVTISQVQLDKFVSAVTANARPLQPVNNRLVLRPAPAVHLSAE